MLPAHLGKDLLENASCWNMSLIQWPPSVVLTSQFKIQDLALEKTNRKYTHLGEPLIMKCFVCANERVCVACQEEQVTISLDRNSSSRSVISPGQVQDKHSN